MSEESHRVSSVLASGTPPGAGGFAPRIGPPNRGGAQAAACSSSAGHLRHARVAHDLLRHAGEGEARVAVVALVQSDAAEHVGPAREAHEPVERGVLPDGVALHGRLLPLRMRRHELRVGVLRVVLELRVEQERPADAHACEGAREQLVRVGHQLGHRPGHEARVGHALAAKLLLDDPQVVDLVVLREPAVAQHLFSLADEVAVVVVPLEEAVLTVLPGAVRDRRERLGDPDLGECLLRAGQGVHAAEEDAGARRVRVARARESSVLLGLEIDGGVHGVPLQIAERCPRRARMGGS